MSKSLMRQVHGILFSCPGEPIVDRIEEIERAALEHNERLNALESMRVETPKEPRDQPGIFRFAKSLGPPTELLSALTVLGLLTYATSWICIRNFYNYFSVRPDDIGATYAAILSRTSTIIGMYLIVYICGLLIASGISHELRKWEKPLRLREAVIVTIALVILTAGGTIALSRYFYGPPSMFTLTLIAILGTIVIVPVWMVFFSHRRPIYRGANENRMNRPLVLGTIIIVIVGALLLPLDRISSATAKEVHNGRAPHGAATLLRFFLGIDYARVYVEWVPENSPEGFPGLFTYLGNSGDIVILYDSTKQATYRVSAQNILMSHA